MAGISANSRGSRKRLGRGLSSLMQQPIRVEPESPAAVGDQAPRSETTDPVQNVQTEPRQPGGDGGPDVRLISIRQVKRNPFQPRKDLDQSGIESLAASIRTAGLMQPILVRPAQNGIFELVAGERRWLAAGMAGLDRIPAIIADLTDTQSAQWAVIENLQREDLDPIEKAEAFRSLVDRFGLTHSQVAERVGLDRSSVANFIRLNSLDDQTKTDLRSGRLTQGHAKALLALQDPNIRRTLAEQAMRGQWSVRQLECEVDEILNPTPRPTRAGGAVSKPDHVRDLEERISAALGVPARIRQSRTGKRGQILLTFRSVDEFESLLARLENQNPNPPIQG